MNNHDSPANSSQSEILLVEDDDGIRSAIREILQLRGYLIIEENDTIRTLNKLSVSDARLVISDYDNQHLMVPELAIQMFCAAAPEMRFVLLVSEDDPVADLETHGQIKILQKPLRPEVLLEMIAESLPQEASLGEVG